MKMQGLKVKKQEKSAATDKAFFFGVFHLLFNVILRKIKVFTY